ncbi:MAG: hypothetical protein ACJ72W_15020 [Actinoallomurus sp.]
MMLFWTTLALVSVILILSGVARGGLAAVPFGIVFLFPSLLWLFRVVREGVHLTPEEMIIRQLGTRRIPWSEVADVNTGEAGGFRCVQISERGKGIIKLPVPADRWLLREANFNEKAEVLRSYWLDHRPIR